MEAYRIERFGSVDGIVAQPSDHPLVWATEGLEAAPMNGRFVSGYV